MSYRRKTAQALALASGLALASTACATNLVFNNTRSDGQTYVGLYSNSSDPVSTYGTDVDFGANATGTTTVVENASNTYTFNYQKGNAWTPNVSMSYGVGPLPAVGVYYTGPASSWPNGAALLSGNFPNNPNDDFYFTFTAAPGYAVRINSYQMVNGSFGAISSACTLYENAVGGSTMIPTFVPANVGSGPGQNVTVDLLNNHGSTFYAGTLVLDIHQTNGNPGVLGITNLNFDQEAVPEPATLSCLSIGGLALLRRRRRA
jgi:hypothetical protein